MHLCAPQTLQALFEELVALDRANMEAHFSAVGDRFESSKRLRSLDQEWQDGAEFLIYYQYGGIAGYLECMPNANGGLAVRSLQTDVRYSRQGTLRALLGAAYAALAMTPFVKVTSGAHPSNAVSIEFHLGLGFQVVGRREASHGGERILFETQVDTLRQRLARFNRAGNAVERTSCRKLQAKNAEQQARDAV